MRQAPAHRSAAEGKSFEDLLHVSFFDSFRLELRGRPVKIKNKKGQALIAYLLVGPTPRESRERLGGLLWSESSEEKARGSLRQALHGIREAFDAAGFSGLEIGRDDVEIDRSRIRVDLWDVLESAAAHEVPPLLLEEKRLPERLLPDLGDLDPSFRVWLMVQRQMVQQKLGRHLAAALAEADGQPAAAKPIATALLNIDPTDEEASRRLMQAHAELGDVAGALRVYKALWDLLDEEYDTEPSDSTQDLVVRIKNNEVAARPPAPPPGSAARGGALTRTPSAAGALVSSDIRVQPLPAAPTFLGVADFDSRAVPQEHSYLVHGLRHDLIARLVRFRDWSVIDWTGQAIHSSHEDVRIFTLDVTVRQAAAALVMTLTIKEQPHFRYIWSESFTLEMANWFDLQQTVVRRIAMALNVHLSAERLVSNAMRPDVSLNVYDRWLRGHQLLFSWRSADQLRAAQIFQSIIEEAPHFAPVYGGLVQIYNAEHIVFPGILRTPERERRTLELAKVAVQSDPFDSRAHLGLGWSFAMNGHFEQAELSYELALDLNENDPWTLISAAQGLAFCGRVADAARLARLALDVDLQPSKSHWGYQVGIRFLCGDYEGCVEAADLAEDIIPNLPAWKASALSHLGRPKEAEAEARRFVSAIRSNWHAAPEPEESAIFGWLMQSFPIRNRGDRDRLCDGLVRANAAMPQECRA